MGTVSEETKKISNAVLRSLQTSGINDSDLYDLIALAQSAILDDGDKSWGLQVTDYVKKCKDYFYGGVRDAVFEDDVFWDAVKVEAQNMIVDSYFLYLEKNREFAEQFYLPRRSVFLKHGITEGFQDILDDKIDILCISGVPGLGKAQPLYSKVLTPNGFVNMGDIHVGDRVIAGNGNISNVIGVYPQGKKPIYELTFDDNSKCRCSDEHLWSVKTRNDRRQHKSSRVLQLSEMLPNLRIGSDNRCNYSVDYVPRIDFTEKDFVIHPYVMGVLLGDGCLSTGSCAFALGDIEILDYVNEFLPNGYVAVNSDRCTYRIRGHEGNNAKAGSLVSIWLKKYGLWGKRSHEKFIPNDYLYASYEQRLWMLRGLMDTDGCAMETVCEYSTSSKQLANDIAELVHSLGGYAKISLKEKCGYKKDGEYIRCKPSYRLIIQFDSEKPSIFAIKRKKNKYNPKRCEILRFIKDAKYIGEEECQCIMIDDPCHLYITDDYIITHNTTSEKFFNSGVIGWFPNDYNLFYSHSGDITRMYYDGVLSILTDTQEYTWHEIFPNLNVTSTNAKAQSLNVGKYKPFASLQTASVGSENAGKVRASKFLLVDDMIGKLEEALNKNTLDKLWAAYSVDARQRKTKDTSGKFCKEIHFATRWSVHDVIGRLERAYEGSDRIRIIRVPDVDPYTGESNYLYEVGGFTVEDFKDQALLMDDVSYRCLYKQEPVEREGLLYPADSLRRYLELPDRDPDAILGICDTKGKGTDFLFLPCMYQYDNDYYCEACICSDEADYEIQYGRMVNLITEHNMQQCEFESNRDGDRVAYEVSSRLKDVGARCNITTHYTLQNKETKIIVNADWVKKHVLFKDKSMYTPKEDYGVMMNFLTSHTVTGKNKVDDVVDGLASFALYVTGNQPMVAKIIKSPF